jgi:hypothetical protein
MQIDYGDDALTVARVFIDRFGAAALYWAMCRLSLGDSGEIDAWREVVSAIEELQTDQTLADGTIQARL